MYDINTLSPLKKHWLLRTSNIPRRFIGLEPSDITEKVGSFPGEVSSWVEDVTSGQVIKSIGNIGVNGVGLVFDGGPGLGKTTHAVVAAMEFIRRLDLEKAKDILQYSNQSDYGLMSRPVYYLTYPEFLSRKKATFDADADEKREMNRQIEGFHGRAKEDWLNVRLLILDDLGKEYGSKYDDASFDEILRSRYDRALPTIVTTNEMLENWSAKYSMAMASFANEAFHRVRLTGKDLRRAKG
jgi:DNA replication protein DnaC